MLRSPTVQPNKHALYVKLIEESRSEKSRDSHTVKIKLKTADIELTNKVNIMLTFKPCL